MYETQFLEPDEPRSEVMSLPLLLTVKQVVALGAGSERTVRRMCERNVLTASKIGTNWRISRDSVIEYFGLRRDLRHAEMEYRARIAKRASL